jgi:hypothetical protein
MKSWKDENWRGRSKMVMFAITPALLLVIVAECLTALAIHRRFWVETDDLTGRQTYVFRMGYYPWSLESRTPLNSLGFPDEEFVNIRPKSDCYHVVFVGDSFTFGDGVNRDDNYVSLVRSWAARRFPERCIRFFNLGERATTIEQHARNIENNWSVLQPDVVILGQYQNDLTDLTKPGFAGHVASPAGGGAQRNWSAPKVRIPIIGASIVRWLSYRSIAILTQSGIHYDLLSRWSVLAEQSNRELAGRLIQQYVQLYYSTLDKIRSRGAMVGVVIIPSKFDVLAGRSPEQEFFLKLAEERNVPALALYSAFDQSRDRYQYLMYDGHLNTYGNYLVAKAMMRWLFDDEPAPFAALRHEESLVTGAPTDSARTVRSTAQ